MQVKKPSIKSTAGQDRVVAAILLPGYWHLFAKVRAQKWREDGRWIRRSLATTLCGTIIIVRSSWYHYFLLELFLEKYPKSHKVASLPESDSQDVIAWVGLLFWRCWPFCYGGTLQDLGLVESEMKVWPFTIGQLHIWVAFNWTLINDHEISNVFCGCFTMSSIYYDRYTQVNLYTELHACI